MALVKLESFEFVWEAELVRALLESEGIASFVFDAEHIRINWALSNAMGGVRVMVNANDLELAQNTLERWRAGDFAEPQQQETCISCNSPDLKDIYNSKKNGYSFFSMTLLQAKKLA
ncbi:MAG: DUF2007 domain-containing protein [Gammaproteobacteria bacterium]|nr:DUF2007 domain-containing protein [Gammaproteobacteria bacterium]